MFFYFYSQAYQLDICLMTVIFILTHVNVYNIEKKKKFGCYRSSFNVKLFIVKQGITN